MTVWLGQLVISKTDRSPAFRIQYWRKPSMTPAYLRFESLDDVRLYLRHCRLSNITPDQVIEQLRTASEVCLNTIECEERIG